MLPSLQPWGFLPFADGDHAILFPLNSYRGTLLCGLEGGWLGNGGLWAEVGEKRDSGASGEAGKRLIVALPRVLFLCEGRALDLLESAV